jgi:hypothetical protein
MAAFFRAFGLCFTSSKAIALVKVLINKCSSFRVWYTGFSKDFIHGRTCCALLNFNEDSEIAGSCQGVDLKITDFCKWSSGTCSRAIKLAL